MDSFSEKFHWKSINLYREIEGDDSHGRSGYVSEHTHGRRQQWREGHPLILQEL